MIHREVSKLEPITRVRVVQLLKKLDELGLPYGISETLRDYKTQVAYFAQGRQDLETVNKLRRIAGLYIIGEQENKSRITWTLKSKHIEGKAIDIVGVKNGRLTWDMPDEFWKTIAVEATKLGLESGYYWVKKDLPHHQMP